MASLAVLPLGQGGPTQSLSIGTLATQAGTGVETVRFYERQGLLKAARTPSGYRKFDAEAVVRLRFIAQTKSLGFTLAEIRELLDLRLDPRATRENVRARTRRKLSEIENKISQLESMRAALRRLLGSCHGGGSASDCPILESLRGQS